MTAPVSVTLTNPSDYVEWRDTARELLANGVEPAQVGFGSDRATGDLFADAVGATGTDLCVRTTPGARDQPAMLSAPEMHNASRMGPRVPRNFPALARRVLCHRDPVRFGLLYRLLWRLQQQPQLLDNASDHDVWTARRMAKAVQRDAHKMKAFVRFRRVDADGRETYVAWFEPQHHIVEYTAPFFSRRFTGMNWSIVTPGRSAHWDGATLRFGAGASRSDCPDADALEAHWRVYYASIFNPARLKLNAMRAEMPVRYWRNLPESRLIPELARSARRAQRAAPRGTAPSVATARRLVACQPAMRVETEAMPRTLGSLARALQQCERCELCHVATAAVPGEGPANARLMLVGEQPGDREDLAGRPFVGPAGLLLDEILAEAGIDRHSVYLTNAVKHFKHRLRGKRRIHQRPNPDEIEHCRWWLGLEREIVAPRVTVALGATAARALLGRSVRVGEVRGRPFTDEAGNAIFVTVHPAYLLRLPDAGAAQAERQRFVSDLRAAGALLD